MFTLASPRRSTKLAAQRASLYQCQCRRSSSICPTMAAIQIWSSRYRTRGGIEISSSRYRTRVSKIIALTRIPPENQWIRQLFRNEQRRPFARTIVILPDNERDDLGAILSQGDTGAQQSANTQKER